MSASECQLNAMAIAIIWKVALLNAAWWNPSSDELALSNELKRLESAWSSLDGWLDLWSSLVVFGVAVELFVLVIEYRHELHEFRRGIVRPPDKPSLSLLLWGFLGAALVVLGVAGELAVHFKAGKVETDMRGATTSLVAIVNGKAVDANERASANEKEAARFRSEAAELQAVIQPRDLTPKEQSELHGSVIVSKSNRQSEIVFL